MIGWVENSTKGLFTLSLAIAIPKSDSLVIVMLAKELAYPTHSLAKSLVKSVFFHRLRAQYERNLIPTYDYYW